MRFFGFSDVKAQESAQGSKKGIKVEKSADWLFFSKKFRQLPVNI